MTREYREALAEVDAQARKLLEDANALTRRLGELHERMAHNLKADQPKVLAYVHFRGMVRGLKSAHTLSALVARLAQDTPKGLLLAEECRPLYEAAVRHENTNPQAG